MKIRSGSRCEFPNQKITMSMSSLSATDCLRAHPGGLIYNPDLLWRGSVFCQYTLQFWLSVKSVGHKIALPESLAGLALAGESERLALAGPARPVLLTLAQWHSLSLQTQTGYRIIHISASGLAKHNIYAQIQCLQIFFLTLTIEPFLNAPVAMIYRYTRTFWSSLVTISSNSLVWINNFRKFLESCSV